MVKIEINKELAAFVVLIIVLFFGAFQIVAAKTVTILSDSTADVAHFIGKVGIGTSEPKYNLHIYNTSSNAGLDIQSLSDTNSWWGIYNNISDDSLRFWASNFGEVKNNIIVFSDGVGIGTTDLHEYMLNINGDARVSGPLNSFYCNDTIGYSGSFSDGIPVGLTLCGGIVTNITTVVGSDGYVYIGNGDPTDCHITFVNGVLTETTGPCK